MKLDFDIFRLAGAALDHASARQSVVAQNIANADTPDYRARDIEPFEAMYDRLSGRELAMRATRKGHIGAVQDNPKFEASEATAFGAEAPNGNNVSLEDQMFRGAQVKGQHDLALGIYQKSLTILRTAVARK